MSTAPSDRPLSDRAAQDLRYIRTAMERASAFTAVSGRGYIMLGITALVATAVAARTHTFTAWLAVWGVELVVAALTAIVMISAKAKRIGVPLDGGAARKLLLAFTPVMAAGGALTFALAVAGARTLLPGTWLAVYGAAVIAGGVYSIPPVPIIGAGLLGLGIASLLLPALPGDLMLALGFGAIHIIGGIIIARRHGG